MSNTFSWSRRSSSAAETLDELRTLSVQPSTWPSVKSTFAVVGKKRKWMLGFCMLGGSMTAVSMRFGPAGLNDTPAGVLQQAVAKQIVWLVLAMCSTRTGDHISPANGAGP